jgi:transglutaminase-like putative cysteine protease
MKKRKIDQRFKPPVKGIDLFQSMNYIALKDVSVDFIYGNYSSSTICHVPGSRPVLEKLARSLRIRPHNAYRQTAALAKYVAEEVLWAGFYERKTGHKLAPDRNMTEEQILRSGYGWCNEQARLFSALTQICGIPSRLVFACCPQDGCWWTSLSATASPVRGARSALGRSPTFPGWPVTLAPFTISSVGISSNSWDPTS